MSQEVVEASAAQLHVALQGRNERVGCAESLTGGELAAWLSSTPGASATFTGAVVSYAGEVKRDVLGVTAERVVSSDCAEQMATGVRQLLGVDWALSTTGVAGPDEQEGQAVGTVYVGIASTQRVRSVRLALEGDRSEIRGAVCAAALQLLLQEVTRG
jgi:nicotinamide-nucleotide amidase